MIWPTGEEEEAWEDVVGVGEVEAVADDLAFDSKLAVCSRVLTMSNLYDSSDTLLEHWI